jgi:hypothetical protein
MTHARGDGGRAGVGQLRAQPRRQRLYEHPRRTVHTPDTAQRRKTHWRAGSTVGARKSHRRRRSRWRKRLRWSAVSCNGTGRTRVVSRSSRRRRTDRTRGAKLLTEEGVAVAMAAGDATAVAALPVTFLDKTHRG